MEIRRQFAFWRLTLRTRRSRSWPWRWTSRRRPSSFPFSTMTSTRVTTKTFSNPEESFPSGGSRPRLKFPCAATRPWLQLLSSFTWWEINRSVLNINALTATLLPLNYTFRYFLPPLRFHEKCLFKINQKNNFLSFPKFTKQFNVCLRTYFFSC